MAAKNPLRRRLQAGEACYGLWIGTESPSVSEAAVALGLDWVCIDMEHGHLDFHDVMDHIRAVRGSETAAVVRVPGVEMSAIKRALDMGAHPARAGEGGGKRDHFRNYVPQPGRHRAKTRPEISHDRSWDGDGLDDPGYPRTSRSGRAANRPEYLVLRKKLWLS